jgi:hypothetical protein
VIRIVDFLRSDVRWVTFVDHFARLQIEHRPQLPVFQSMTDGILPILPKYETEYEIGTTGLQVPISYFHVENRSSEI